jgi:hypothetical protein
MPRCDMAALRCDCRHRRRTCTPHAPDEPWHQCYIFAKDEPSSETGSSARQRCKRSEYEAVMPLEPAADGTVRTLARSYRFCDGRGGIGGPVTSMTEPSTERAVIHRATNGAAIGAISRRSHLLRHVHVPVDHEVRGAFGDRRSDTLTGPDRLA